MRRGDLVAVAIPGDFGKPRPALVIQADTFETTTTVTVVLLTSTLADAPLLRVNVSPSAQNGLHKPSQIMVDKIMTVRHDKLAAPFGRLEGVAMTATSRALAVFLGVA